MLPNEAQTAQKRQCSIRFKLAVLGARKINHKLSINYSAVQDLAGNTQVRLKSNNIRICLEMQSRITSKSVDQDASKQNYKLSRNCSTVQVSRAKLKPATQKRATIRKCMIAQDSTQPSRCF